MTSSLDDIPFENVNEKPFEGFGTTTSLSDKFRNSTAALENVDRLNFTLRAYQEVWRYDLANPAKADEVASHMIPQVFRDNADPSALLDRVIEGEKYLNNELHQHPEVMQKAYELIDKSYTPSVSQSLSL